MNQSSCLMRLLYAQEAGNFGELAFQHVQAGMRAAAARGGGAQQRRVDAAHHGVGHDGAGRQGVQLEGLGIGVGRPSEVALIAMSQASGRGPPTRMASAG